MDAINNTIAHASFGAILATGWIVMGVATFAIATFIGFVIRTPQPARWLPPIGPGYPPRYIPARTWRPILIRAAIAAASMMFLLLPLFLLLAFAGVANNTHKQSTAQHRY